ncbi:hypothetical protein A8950_3486 [Dongia mobilis]|uniref:Lipoprotein n=2 Tax=Dongia mobilis TaxID=578943 RepID=A0A4R6WQ05_9PROT|nr:hypothetical protein A8950_3486 [Dongia mobilis]
MIRIGFITLALVLSACSPEEKVIASAASSNQHSPEDYAVRLAAAEQEAIERNVGWGALQETPWEIYEEACATFKKNDQIRWDLQIWFDDLTDYRHGTEYEILVYNFAPLSVPDGQVVPATIEIDGVTFRTEASKGIAVNAVHDVRLRAISFEIEDQRHLLRDAFLNSAEVKLLIGRDRVNFKMGDVKRMALNLEKCLEHQAASTLQP